MVGDFGTFNWQSGKWLGGGKAGWEGEIAVREQGGALGQRGDIVDYRLLRKGWILGGLGGMTVSLVLVMER